MASMHFEFAPEGGVPPGRPGSGRACAAIDLVHLGRQSLGDRNLEIELLRLFDRQAARIAAELTMPDLAGAALCERRDLAHTLKGSARAIGAAAVAGACEAYERATEIEHLPAEAAAAAALVREAVGECRRAIAGLLPGN